MFKRFIGGVIAIIVGLSINDVRLGKGWHTYWRSADDAGAPRGKVPRATSPPSELLTQEATVTLNHNRTPRP